MNAELKVDEATCKRVGALAAYGIGEREIANALLLSEELMEQVRNTDAYKKAYAEKAAERVERAVAMEEGWDGVEQLGIEKVLDALAFNVDPRFALQAAAIANRAQRRTAPHKVINATVVNKVVVLTLNQRFVTKLTGGAGAGVIEGESRDMSAVPRKQVDLPTPRKVSEMLQLSGQKDAIQALVREESVSEIDLLAGKHGICDELFEE